MNTERIVLNAILARRSIRKFQENKLVEKEKIEQLLKAAMAAPSACNIQPWEFIVIQNDEMIDKIKRLTENNGQYNVNTIIAICGNNKHIPWKDHGILDCGAAMENMMILAQAIGLGTVVIGGFNKEKTKEYLDIVEDVEPICLVYVGYPDEKKKARTKYIEEAIHWEKFNKLRKDEPRPGNIIAFGVGASL